MMNNEQLDILPCTMSAVVTNEQDLAATIEQDAQIDWVNIFTVAQQQNDQSVVDAVAGSQPCEVVYYRNEHSKQILKNVVIGLTMMAMLYLVRHLILSIPLSSASHSTRAAKEQAAVLHSLVSLGNFMMILVAVASMLMVVWAAFCFVFMPEKRTVTKEATATDPEAIRLVVPPPISYAVEATTGSEGHIVAAITRTTPTVQNNRIVTTTSPVAQITMSDIDDTAQQIDEFDELLRQLDDWSRAASKPYRELLAQHGMDEASRMETEIDLRLRAEAGIERKMLNEPVVDSLNQFLNDRSQLVESV